MARSSLIVWNKHIESLIYAIAPCKDIIFVEPRGNRIPTVTTPKTVTRTVSKTSTKTAAVTYPAIDLINKSNKRPVPFKFDMGGSSGSNNSFFSMSSDKTKWKNPGFVSDWVTARPPFKSRKVRKDRRRSK
jgi:hypothetical protein